MFYLKALYKSFIPYLLLLVVLLLAILLLDSFAEKISTEPRRINILAGNNTGDVNGESWLYSEPSSMTSATQISSDSLFVMARENYREKHTLAATEMFTRLSKKYHDSPVPFNYLGLIAMRGRDYSEAEKYFRTSLGIDSSYTSGVINMAILCTRMQRYSEAESLYMQAKQLSPYNAKVYYNLGLLHARMKTWRKARGEFMQSIELSSGDQKAMAYCQHGNVQLQLSDTLGARESFAQAILYKPDYEKARAYFALTIGDPAEKEKELLKIYRLNPRSYYANYYLGLFYAEVPDPGKAEFHLQHALERNPHDENAMEALANLMMDQGRLEEARIVLSGFDSKDTLPQSYFHHAKLAARENNSDLAIGLYRKAINKSSNEYPEAQLNLAILYKQRNETEKAIQSYINALGSRPDYARACYNLALLYSEIDSSDRAIHYYRQAIRKDPAAYKSWYNIGILLKERGEVILARDAFASSLRIRPEYLKALMALGNLYLNQGDYDNSVRIYHDLLTRYPNYAKGWFNMGLAHSRSGRAQDAIDAYEKVIAIDPENIRARINLGVIYARSRDYKNAASVFEDAMDLDMGNPDIRFNLALQYERLDLPGKAIYQYYKAIELDSSYLKAYDNLTDLYSASGDTAGMAIVAFHRMMLDPHRDSLYAMGKKLHDLGEIGLAREAYFKVKELGMDGKWIEYWIGKAYMDQSEFEPAMARFEKVLELDGQHKFAYYRLGQIYEILGRPQDARRYYAILTHLDPEFIIVHKKTRGNG